MNTATLFGLTGNELMVAGLGAVLFVAVLIGMALGRRNGTQEVVERRPARRMGLGALLFSALLVLLFINYMVPGGLYTIAKMTGAAR